MRFVSVTALSVMLPADQVGLIASRDDVQSISPNRMTARTATQMTPSHIEASSGVALSVRQRTTSNGLFYNGLDGRGVGVAVLDSGVMSKHQLFDDSTGQSRVKRAVNFLKVGDSVPGGRSWQPGVDLSTTTSPGTEGRAAFERSVDNANGYSDGYGHGSHVAAVALGRDFKQTLDTTGIAPAANLYDVKVLDNAGFGQLSDVLAGIDWVLFHARQYNIRVINLSLGADSTESYLTDPLARAARSAVAAGITVVVSAGNFGQRADGKEQFGTISSPGHEPSVITVGSANSRNTAARSDDSVNFFSSRGPTRGAYTDSTGVRHVDNFLKPDLVAPGNKILSALAVTGDTMSQLSYLPKAYPALYNVPAQSSCPARRSCS
jgi:subtilisin family serine protease